MTDIRLLFVAQSPSISGNYPPISNLFIEAMRGRQDVIVVVSGVAELYNLHTTSRSDWRRCRHVELHRAKNGLDHVAGVWAVLILAVIIQSILGVTVAGARPEASRLIIMMTLPFTVGMSVVAMGAAMAIGWWRSRRQVASGDD